MTADTVQRPQTVEASECKCATDTPMSVPEAAPLLRCSREYLYSGLRDGRFPGTQVGRSWKIPGAFVQGFLRDVLNVGGRVSFEDYAADWRAKNSAEATA